jgi:hypothetical protein
MIQNLPGGDFRHLKTPTRILETTKKYFIFLIAGEQFSQVYGDILDFDGA